MRYTEQKLVFQEVPDETSLALLVSGCPLKCHGCHSAESWSFNAGHQLDQQELLNLIHRHEGWITCVLFLGGEWHENELLSLLDLCLEKNLKTALYTGLDDVSPQLKEKLHYLKIGKFISALGGLDSPTTNQKIFNLKTGELLNFKFLQSSGRINHDSTASKSAI